MQIKILWYILHKTSIFLNKHLFYREIHGTIVPWSCLLTLIFLTYHKPKYAKRKSSCRAGISSTKPATCAIFARWSSFMKFTSNLFIFSRKIHLIVEVYDECFLFVEYYAPAKVQRKQRPNWESDFIPNWPHLKTMDDSTQKYVIIWNNYE